MLGSKESVGELVWVSSHAINAIARGVGRQRDWGGQLVSALHAERVSRKEMDWNHQLLSMGLSI